MTATIAEPMAARPLLLRPVAPAAWDRLLWVSGGVGACGVILSAFVPRASELAVFFSLTLLSNGPYALVLPVVYEPILMVFGRLYPPFLLAVLGTAGVVAVEVVNYRLFAAAVHWQRLERARTSAVVRRVVVWFQRQPFLTVALCALTPLPFWAARICASIARYPSRQFLLATATGRLPRLWFYAALGTVVPLSGAALLAVGLAASLLIVVAASLRRARGRP